MTFMIDYLIGFNIIASISLLMIAIYFPRTFPQKQFPQLLFGATLYRLCIYLLGTRQILLFATAGTLIDQFGHFNILFVGENCLVRSVLFALVTLLFFTVITKTVDRVSVVLAKEDKLLPAMKMLKMEAIAAVAFLLVTLLAGMSMSGMTVTKAFQTYSPLTIGLGLVCQIPALLFCIATGIHTTRSYKLI